MFFRPIGLTVFLLSLPIAFFFPPVTVVAGLLYAGSCYWAFQKYRNKMFPPGTMNLIRSVPYRRRRSAHLALEYAKDIQGQIAALPPEIQSRVPVTDEEVGAMAAAAVKMYVYEENFRQLADEGTRGARDQAQKTAKRAAKIIDDLKQLQRGILGVSLASSTSDIALLDDAAASALEEIARLRHSIEGARAEIDDYIELEGLPEFAALEAKAAEEAEEKALVKTTTEDINGLNPTSENDDTDVSGEAIADFGDNGDGEPEQVNDNPASKPIIPEPRSRPDKMSD